MELDADRLTALAEKSGYKVSPSLRDWAYPRGTLSGFFTSTSASPHGPGSLSKE